MKGYITYTYLLIDPRDNKPFYVGQSKDPAKRLKAHIAQRNCNHPHTIGLTYTQERIREICSSQLRPTVKVVGEAWDFNSAREMEDGWMRKLATEGYELTNIFSIITSNGRGRYPEGFVNFSNSALLGD